VGNIRADVESCEELIPARVEDRKRFEKMGESWTAEGFECEVKRSGLKMLGEELGEDNSRGRGRSRLPAK